MLRKIGFYGLFFLKTVLKIMIYKSEIMIGSLEIMIYELEIMIYGLEIMIVTDKNSLSIQKLGFQACVC